MAERCRKGHRQPYQWPRKLQGQLRRKHRGHRHGIKKRPPTPFSLLPLVMILFIPVKNKGENIQRRRQIFKHTKWMINGGNIFFFLLRCVHILFKLLLNFVNASALQVERKTVVNYLAQRQSGSHEKMSFLRYFLCLPFHPLCEYRACFCCRSVSAHVERMWSGWCGKTVRKEHIFFHILRRHHWELPFTLSQSIINCGSKSLLIVSIIQSISFGCLLHNIHKTESDEEQFKSRMLSSRLMLSIHSRFHGYVRRIYTSWHRKTLFSPVTRDLPSCIRPTPTSGISR